MAPEVLVLDTTAFIARLTLYAPRARLVTTPSAASEARDPSSREAVELAVQLGRLSLEEPPGELVARVERAARRHGIRGLSRTDLEVAALALSYRLRGASVVLVTDDYALQALASLLGIRFQPLRTRGIQGPWEARRRPRRPPERRCPACGAPLPRGATRCPVCGARL